MADGRKVQMALIGLGHVAKHIVSAAEMVADVDIIAACDKDETRRSWLRKEIAFCTDPETFIHETGADFFFIATPPETHAPLAEHVIDAGKNVVVEKPVTLDKAAFDTLTGHAERTNVFFATAFHARYARDLEWFLEARETDPALRKLGEITGFRCSFFDPYGNPLEVDDHARRLGGSWMDSGVNALSAIERFLDISAVFPEDVWSIQREWGSLQTNAHFKFSHPSQRNPAYQGLIETNWGLGLNLKKTVLDFAHSGHVITLDHTTETVLQESGAGKKTIADLSTNYDRLTNHYISLIDDMCSMFKIGKSNIELSKNIHRLLFNVSEIQGNGE